MTYSRLARAVLRGALVGGRALTVATSVAAADLPANFLIHETPKPLPAVGFEDGDGKRRSLADFGGKVVVLNIWATWCGPCRREMPTLDRLQATLGGPVFEVVALSIDRAGLDVIGKFYAEIGIERLAMYVDTTGKAARDLGVLGLPTTLLLDGKGRELGRLVGIAEWDAPGMVEFLRGIVSSHNAALIDRAESYRSPREEGRP